MKAIGTRLAFAAMLAQLGISLLCCAAGWSLFADAEVVLVGTSEHQHHAVSSAHHGNGLDEACPVCEKLCTFAAALFAALVVVLLSLQPIGRLKVAIVSSLSSHRYGTLFQSRAPPRFA